MNAKRLGVAAALCLTLAGIRWATADTLQCLNVDFTCDFVPCTAQQGYCLVGDVGVGYNKFKVVSGFSCHCDDGGSGCTSSMKLDCITAYFNEQYVMPCSTTSVCKIVTFTEGCGDP